MNRLRNRLLDWWIPRQVRRGKYYDPITERRRRAKAARFEE